MEDIIGTGWSFPPHFLKGGAVEMTSGTAEIEGSLSIIFSTRLGDRLFRPDFGCDLEAFQFSSMDTMSVNRIRRIIEQTVVKYEPRINLLDVDIEGSDLQEGKLRIVLKYSLKDKYSKDNVVYPFYYENNL